MRKEKILKFILILTMTALLFQGTLVIAYAKEQSVEVSSNIYKFEKNNDFTITKSGQADSTLSAIGKLNILGEIETDTPQNGIATYIVDGNEVVISYGFDSNKVSPSNPSEWYVVDTKDKSVDDIKLEKSISKGSVIIQTSLTGEDWITSREYTDVFDTNVKSLNDLYHANDVQLQNGCFYRVLVVYEQERVVRQKKIGFVKTDEKELRRIAEEYVFFAECKEKGQVLSPDTSPKKIFGKKGEVSTVVNTGKDKGYCLSQGKDILDADDPQYGWALGYFTVNGYTSDTRDDEGNYIFLKNVGDQVTLWFTLEKDITDLKGDGRLSIAEDDNGEDLDFQTEKTNFKHGALIIRYLDSEDGSEKPIIYTDYLAANARTEANTKVTLFEEGDYEIALDYEIKNVPRKIGSVAVIPEYTDYKLYFKFSIRNGNCMAYPFDNKTGSELRDNDICEEGFTIKLAGSRYNDVTMKYDVVVGEEGQKKYDTRKNTTAKEGASYSDEGVYTFCVTNKYTGITSTKTIYVGTDPYIKALSKSGKTLSDINDKIQQGYIITEDGSIIMPKVEESEVEENKESEIAKEEDIVEEKIEEALKTIVENKAEEEKSDEVFTEDSRSQNRKKSFLTVPIVVVVIIVIGIIVYILKNKRRIEKVSNDSKEEK